MILELAGIAILEIAATPQLLTMTPSANSTLGDDFLSRAKITLSIPSCAKLRERFATIIGGPPQLRDRDASTCRTLMLLPAALSPRARKTLPTPDSHDFSGTGYDAVRPFNIR